MNKPTTSPEFKDKLVEFLLEGKTFTPNYVGAKKLSISEVCSEGIDDTT